MPILYSTDETLPEQYKEYLDQAISYLIDSLFDDVTLLMEQPNDIDNTLLITHLPPTKRTFYTPVFCKKFFLCVSTVAWKLKSLESQRLACTAEELALNALFNTAESLAEIDGITLDFGQYYDLYFEDTDFELLFDPGRDGIENDDIANLMGFANLSVQDWFRPFRYPDNHVHPYATDDSE